jgi:hypothetical protein
VKENSWLAARVLNNYADTPGLKTLHLELDLAPKIQISEDLVSVWKAFSSLGPKDVSAIITESAFPNSILWIEWYTDDNFLPTWVSPAYNNMDAAPKQMGALIKTTKDCRSGVIQFISGTDQLLILPVSLSFDWHESFSVAPDTMNELRKSLEETDAIKYNGIKVTDENIEALLQIRSRFSVNPTEYIEIPQSMLQSMGSIYDSAYIFLLYMEPLIISLANILECSKLETWRKAKLMIH